MQGIAKKLQNSEVSVAIFRVERLTLQARKLWFVGVATDRHARYL